MWNYLDLKKNHIFKQSTTLRPNKNIGVVPVTNLRRWIIKKYKKSISLNNRARKMIFFLVL